MKKEKCHRCNIELKEQQIEVRCSLIGQDTIVKNVDAKVCPKCEEINITPFESRRIDRERKGLCS